jgi:hypothetical protein
MLEGNGAVTVVSALPNQPPTMIEQDIARAMAEEIEKERMENDPAKTSKA